MKFKALRTIKEPQEFVHIDTIDGTMLMYTCDLPRPQPLTATLENMKEYYINNPSLPGTLTFDDLELVEFEMFEVKNSQSVGADIRNKLSPPLNLVALLRIYFTTTDDKEADLANMERILPYIKKEMENSERCIKYIAGLL
jgi:hypothetical protein